MVRLLRLALVVAYLAAAAVPCAESGARRESPEQMRAYAAGALHAHGAPPGSRDGAVRAPCLCGCDESPAGRVVASPLGAAMIPAQAMPVIPRATHFTASSVSVPRSPAQLPDPVPRLA